MKYNNFASFKSLIILFITCLSFGNVSGQCNTQASICEPGVAGPFNFIPTGGAYAGGSFANAGCNTGAGGNHSYGFITLYITQSGSLNVLINANTTNGFIDVAIFIIPEGVAPCDAILDGNNAIGCNFASDNGGCVQFGTAFPCNSSVPAPNVNAGDQVMIIAQDYSNANTTFNLELGPPPGAQTGPPDATITPSGPYCDTDAPNQLNAVNMGGTWSGPGITTGGVFDPSLAGPGTHTINYTIGQAPCDDAASTTITVNICTACLISFFEANISACINGTGSYDVTGVVEYQDAPTTGNLIVEDCFGTQHIIASAPFPAGGVSYTIPGLPANGAACSLTTYFSADPTCENGPLDYIAPTCDCFFTFMNADISACNPNDNTFEVTGSIEFVNPPATGQLIVEDCNGNQQVFNAPFTSPSNYALTGLDSDGTLNCSVTAYFTADLTCNASVGPYNNPANCLCDADAGTFTDGVVGDANSTNPWLLCFGDELDIIGNGDFSVTENPLIGATYDPGIWLLVYDCPPTIAPPNLINDDPCLLGVASTADQAWTIANTSGSGNTLYFVPLTMYSMVDGIYATSLNNGDWCYDLGPTYPVTFLPQVISAQVQDCQAGTATVTINGGVPAVDGSNFTASNLSPANAVFDNTTAANGGTITISGLVDGDNWSFIITDNNGCPITVSGIFIGLEDPAFTYPNNTYCQDELNPSPTVTGDPGGAFAAAPAGLSINATSGLINLAASTPGTYTVTYTTPDPICFDQATFVITINPVPVIDPIANVTSCFEYILPTITGTNLTGNQSFYTGPGGTGTALAPGAVINTVGTTTIYVYDQTGTIPNCFDEISFTVTILPVIQDMTCPPALTAVCSITEQPAYATYNAFITAGGAVTLPAGAVVDPTTFNLVSEVSDGLSCPETVTRTYEVSDECGVTVSCEQIITINDIINPEGNAPVDVAVQCPTDVPVVDISSLTGVSDNCTVNPVVTHIGDISNGLTCPEVITRTYRITDDCGNFIEVQQTITINDDIAPLGTAPAAVNVQCPTDVPAANIADVTGVSDNCTTNPIVAHVGDVSDGNACPEVITRTYSITDECGNETLITQTITINDDIAPLATAPAAVNVQCPTDVPAANIADVTGVSDNCTTNPIVAHVGDVSDGNACPEVITRTYSITDECGNETLITQTITINDDIAPVGSGPADVAVQCPTDVPAADIALITGVSDNCTTNPIVAHVGDVSDGNACPEVITRTYSIIDECGNETLITQTITINDDIAPLATAPAAVNVQCPTDVPAANVADVTGVSDNCTTNPIVTHVSDVSDGNLCPEVITRTYSIIDECGNETFVTQTITINDDIDPTASNPSDVNVTDPALVPAPDPAVVTDEADNCTLNPLVEWVGDVSDGGNCPEIITRTYSVTDECNNQITVTQLIYIGDADIPTASDPAPVFVQCPTDVPAPDPAVVTDAQDNGAPPVVTWEDDTSDGNTCPEVITRRYRVTDDCGNFIFVQQIITVNDDINPEGNAPVDVAVQCPTDVPVVDISSLTGVSDNCTVNPVVTHIGDISNGLTCPEVITRTYRITDDCGNFIEVQQTITINDDIAPLGTAPAAVNVQCPTDVPAANIADVTGVSDNCTTNPIVAHVGDVSDGNACPEVITRTYSITDECGNETLITQTITINDDIAPVGSGPADVAVQCPTDVPAADIALITGVSDNCTTNPIVAHVGDVSDGNACPEVITRTYSITDECGNETLITQTITINDDIAPVGSGPADVAVQCPTDVPAADIALITGVSDNCTTNPIVTHVSDVSDGNLCPEVITRTYSIIDECGNETLITQTITINDDIAPLATAPAAVNVQCPTDVPAANVADVTGVSDNCTTNPIVTHVSDVSDGNLCPEVISRTYSIIDECGNETFVTQTITINDDIDPVATAPANITVVCQTDVPAPNINDVTGVSDNCAVAPLVEHVGDVSDNNICDGEVITRTYSITDNCGNSITVTQQITISSVTPTFTLTPSDPTECSGTDGQIVVSGLSPNTSYNLSFNGNPSNVITTNAAGEYVIAGLTQGNYTNFVISLANCPMCESINNVLISLLDPYAPELNAGPDVQVCEGEQITLTAVNPEGAIISWNNGVNDGVPFNQAVGTVTYTVTANLDNCISTDQVVVTVHPTPNVFAGNDFTTCAGQSAILTGTGAQTYSWTNGVTNGVAFTPTQTQTYTVTGTSQFGCVATDEVTVTVEELPNPSFEGDNLEGCTPVTTTFTNTSTTALGSECVWYLSNGTVLVGCDNVAYTFTNPGCYDVTLEITSANGCSSSTTFENYVCVQAYPVAYFTYTPNQPTTIYSTLDFSNGSIGASSYEWFFGDGNTSNAIDPSHTYLEIEGSYVVTLVASTPFGCTDTVRSIVNVVEELIFYVPNTFTPDGDEFNETFQPVFTSGYDPFDFHLMIFNRWGELIFESYDASIGWDGTYGGKTNGGELVKDGTYVWKIEVKTKLNDERKMFVGHVNVLK